MYDDYSRTGADHLRSLVPNIDAEPGGDELTGTSNLQSKDLGTPAAPAEPDVILIGPSRTPVKISINFDSRLVAISGGRFHGASAENPAIDFTHGGTSGTYMLQDLMINVPDGTSATEVLPGV